MYIGKTPTVGNFQVCDAISVVNGQAAYTLQVGGTNVAPESANHMLVSLNGILQKPGSSFTISGSTMTFASNLATGDVIDFVQILGNVLDIGQPSDDTVTAAKLATTAITGHTAETSIADGDTLLIHDASASALRKMTKANFVSGIGGSDAIVYAQGNSGTSTSDNTITKIELENEIIDTASLMASSRFTVTSDYQGKYFVSFQMSFNHTATAKIVQATIRKNNTEVQYGQMHSAKGSNHTCVTQARMIIDLTTDDYLEFWGKQDSGGTKSSNGGTATNCLIYKIS